jgi:hypothetical protein
VREPGLPVVDHVDVHDRAAARHRHGHAGRVGSMPDRIGDKFAGQQLSLARGGVAGQGAPDEPAGGRHLGRVPGEGADGNRGHRAGRRPHPGLIDAGLLNAELPDAGLLNAGLLNDTDERTRHSGLRIKRCYCPLPTM